MFIAYTFVADLECCSYYVTKEIGRYEGMAAMRHIFIGRSSDPGTLRLVIFHIYMQQDG